MGICDCKFYICKWILILNLGNFGYYRALFIILWTYETYFKWGFISLSYQWKYATEIFIFAGSKVLFVHRIMVRALVIKRDLPWGIASLVFWSWSFIEPLKSGIPVDPEAVPLREWTGLVCPKLSESIRTNVPDLVRTNFWEFLKLELLGLAFWSNWSSLKYKF